MRCARCGGIIPPGWPVAHYGDGQIMHRFKTWCDPIEGEEADPAGTQLSTDDEVFLNSLGIELPDPDK